MGWNILFLYFIEGNTQGILHEIFITAIGERIFLYKTLKNTILVSPKNPTELEEVVVNIDSDKLILGKWVLTGANALKINKRGKEERKSAKSVPANLKEYTADGSFHVSLNDKEIMKGNYTAFENQINESVVGADIKKLEGIKNILFYVISKDNKTLIVKYQLPKSEYVVEEIWKRL